MIRLLLWSLEGFAVAWLLLGVAIACVAWKYVWAAWDTAAGCICRKGAVHPHCPRHGWERKEHA